jgi:hypothetical protein
VSCVVIWLGLGPGFFVNGPCLPLPSRLPQGLHVMLDVAFRVRRALTRPTSLGFMDPPDVPSKACLCYENLDPSPAIRRANSGIRFPAGICETQARSDPPWRAALPHHAWPERCSHPNLAPTDCAANELPVFGSPPTLQQSRCEAVRRLPQQEWKRTKLSTPVHSSSTRYDGLRLRVRESAATGVRQGPAGSAEMAGVECTGRDLVCIGMSVSMARP